MTPLDKKKEALLRAARHFWRTQKRHDRIVYGPVRGLDPAVDRVRKQLAAATNNLQWAACACAHAEKESK